MPLLALVLFVIPVAVMAGERMALVFGVPRCDALRPLANPLNDTHAISDRLTALGFEVVPESNRTPRRVRHALAERAEYAAGAEVTLVFHAGHGMEVGGRNYLIWHHPRRSWMT